METEPDWKDHISNKHGKVEIGDNTVVRELVIINKPTNTLTKIGTNCYIMNRCFIGHDSELGNHVTMCPGASVAGFVKINDYTCIGMNASIHQNSNIGKCCMIGANSFFKGTSPNGITWGGVPAVPLKVNTVGILRSELDDNEKSIMLESAKLFVDKFKKS